MADLISRAAVKNKIGFVNLYFRAHGQEKYLDDLIDEVPAVNAVEVVRCKDCEWGGKCEVECLLREVDKIPDPYCAAGKRREENELVER